MGKKRVLDSGWLAARSTEVSATGVQLTTTQPPSFPPSAPWMEASVPGTYDLSLLFCLSSVFFAYPYVNTDLLVNYEQNSTYPSSNKRDAFRFCDGRFDLIRFCTSLYLCILLAKQVLSKPLLYWGKVPNIRQYLAANGNPQSVAFGQQKGVNLYRPYLKYSVSLKYIAF